MKRPRLDKLDQRLFGWFFALSVTPALLVLLVGSLVLSRSLDFSGTLGPWGRIADSGAILLDAVEASDPPPELAEAAAQHRAELSESVTLARRWAFVGERFASVLPFIALGLSMVLALVAWRVSRRLSKQLARPARDLVGWTARLAREEPLPEPSAAEKREPREFRILREAFRIAAPELIAARDRAIAGERVRLWGEMARRVAHEMKNALTPLRLGVHRIASEAGPTLRESVQVVDEETRRLEELAAGFAALGRPPAGPVSEVDLTELLQSLLRSDTAPPTTYEIDAPADLPLVPGHYDELVRLFRNLIRNAVEAMHGTQADRRIEVRVQPVHGANGGAPAFVRVDIADRGGGFVDVDDLDRLFEPDFTTKSRGTGLGLALARQTARAHGGTLSAAPRTGGGAVFTVELPVAPR
jgi:signal transduction histidine kinase